MEEGLKSKVLIKSVLDYISPANSKAKVTQSKVAEQGSSCGDDVATRRIAWQSNSGQSSGFILTETFKFCTGSEPQVSTCLKERI